MICTYATQKEKLMRRQNRCECRNMVGAKVDLEICLKTICWNSCGVVTTGQISCARAGVNEVRMCRSKCDARAQVKKCDVFAYRR